MTTHPLPSAGEIAPLSLPGVALVGPTRFGDERGWTAEVLRDDQLRPLGWRGLIQENQNWSRTAGIVRGLHYQATPHGQAKVVRVPAGAMFSVAADIDPSSSSFGQWCAATLDWRNGFSMFVPARYAHGGLSLKDDTLMSWLVDAPFNGAAAAGVAWNDPRLAIDWPLDGRTPILSARDKNLPGLPTPR